MSGLCGVVSLDGSPRLDEVVRRMAAAAPHRGGVRTSSQHDPFCVLGELRRDGGARGPSAPPHQPVVVTDARLDNRDELRSALLRSGHLRDGRAGDGTLLGAAYLAWGERCVERVVGDFALAVWDPRRRRLLLARDALGMRSLFFRVDEGGRRLLVATEVKQVLAAPGVPRRVHELAVAADLVADFGDPGWSFYEGVEQLPPGHALTFGGAGRSARRFWQVDPGHRLRCQGEDDAAEQVRRVFTEAVACRLDVPQPAGVLLSGGVDSGSVAATAGWLAERGAVKAPQVRTYSWAFDELPECDERHVSRHIVERYGLRATDVPADDRGPLAEYPDHLPDADDPFLGAFQPLIEHSLALARADGVGVLLGGDRGDLVIGDTGSSYLKLLLAGRGRELRAELGEHRAALDDPWSAIARRHLLDAVAGRLRRRSPVQWAGWTADRLRGRSRPGTPAAGPPDWVSPPLLDLLRDAVEPASADDELHRRLGPVRAARHDFVFTRLHVRGIAWSERTYARHGLGFADPFSDRRLVELVLALPQALVNRPGDQSKPLMRAAMRGIVPEPARLGADKIVPTPLYEQGLQRRSGLITELLTGSRLEEHGWVDGAALRAHWDDYRRGGVLRPEFWWTLQVEIWLRAHWS